MRLRAQVALDNAVMEAKEGGTVRFMIFTAPPGGNLDSPGLPIEASLADLGLPQKVQVRDLWSHQDLGTMEGKISPVVPLARRAAVQVVAAVVVSRELTPASPS